MSHAIFTRTSDGHTVSVHALGTWNKETALRRARELNLPLGTYRVAPTDRGATPFVFEHEFYQEIAEGEGVWSPIHAEVLSKGPRETTLRLLARFVGLNAEYSRGATLKLPSEHFREKA
jgi:hypothetical protein